jgi:hypothetical protein
VPLLGETPPSLPRIGGARRIQTYLGKVHAGGMEYPGDVVISRDEQLGRVAERLILHEQLRIDMTVGRNDRSRRDLRVQLACEAAQTVVDREQRIGPRPMSR